MSKRHDRLFKELLTLFLYEFLELFLPEIAEAIDPASIEFFDKEMFTELGLGDRREADLVARVAIDGRPAFCLVHVEHQAQHDDVFARRMFRYWNILYERYDLPVYPIAVFSYSTRQVIPEGYEVTTLGFTPLAFKFRAIHLKRLAWRDFARRENPVAAALMARMRVPKRERPRVKLACLRLLANLNIDRARSFYVAHFVEQYLRLNPQEEQEFSAEIESIAPQEREAVMKVTNSWFERGLEQGLERGRQAMRESAAKILEKRFGPIQPDLRRALEAVKDDAQLCSAIVAATEVASPAEFLQRLSARHLDLHSS